MPCLFCRTKSGFTHEGERTLKDLKKDVQRLVDYTLRLNTQYKDTKHELFNKERALQERIESLEQKVEQRSIKTAKYEKELSHITSTTSKLMSMIKKHIVLNDVESWDEICVPFSVTFVSQNNTYHVTITITKLSTASAISSLFKTRPRFAIYNGSSLYKFEPICVGTMNATETKYTLVARHTSSKEWDATNIEFKEALSHPKRLSGRLFVDPRTTVKIVDYSETTIRRSV